MDPIDIEEKYGGKRPDVSKFWPVLPEDVNYDADRVRDSDAATRMNYKEHFHIKNHIERVVDWPDRIKDYSDEVKQIYSKIFETEKEFDELLTDSSLNWHLTRESDELQYETATSKKGMNILRVKARSNYDPVTTARAYLDEDTKKSMDKTLKDVTCLKVIGCNLYEAWQVTNSFQMISSRDLYQYYWIDVKKDNTVKIISYDITDRPHDKDGNIVRMRVPIGALMFVPDQDDSNKCTIHFIIESDLNGHIPNWIKVSSQKEVAKALDRLKSLIPTFIKSKRVKATE